MVGSSSEHVESSGNVSLTGSLDTKSDQQIFDMPPATSCTNNSVEEITQQTVTDSIASEEVIYSTLSDSDDCITIIVSDENDVPISEVETEVVTTEPENESRNLAEFVSSYTVTEDDVIEETCENLSPVKSERALSDCGYESFGSPHSECSDVEMSELWNQDVSELFPNLI